MSSYTGVSQGMWTKNVHYSSIEGVRAGDTERTGGVGSIRLTTEDAGRLWKQPPFCHSLLYSSLAFFTVPVLPRSFFSFPTAIVPHPPSPPHPLPGRVLGEHSPPLSAPHTPPSSASQVIKWISCLVVGKRTWPCTLPERVQRHSGAGSLHHLHLSVRAEQWP